MEATTNRFQLETQLQKDSLLEDTETRLLRSQHMVSKLIKALVSANDAILTAASTTDEPDKVLGISKDICKVLGEIAQP